MGGEENGKAEERSPYDEDHCVVLLQYAISGLRETFYPILAYSPLSSRFIGKSRSEVVEEEPESRGRTRLTVACQFTAGSDFGQGGDMNAERILS